MFLFCKSTKKNSPHKNDLGKYWRRIVWSGCLRMFKVNQLISKRNKSPILPSLSCAANDQSVSRIKRDWKYLVWLSLFSHCENVLLNKLIVFAFKTYNWLLFILKELFFGQAIKTYRIMFYYFIYVQWTQYEKQKFFRLYDICDI